MKNRRKIEVQKENIWEGDFVSIFCRFWRPNGAQGPFENLRKSRKVEKMALCATFAFLASLREGFREDFSGFGEKNEGMLD